jgi:hypothetical protein
LDHLPIFRLTKNVTDILLTRPEQQDGRWTRGSEEPQITVLYLVHPNGHVVMSGVVSTDEKIVPEVFDHHEISSERGVLGEFRG